MLVWELIDLRSPVCSRIQALISLSRSISKTTHVENAKGYVCVFVCFSTRAISYLAGFARFVSFPTNILRHQQNVCWSLSVDWWLMGSGNTELQAFKHVIIQVHVWRVIDTFIQNWSLLQLEANLPITRKSDWLVLSPGHILVGDPHIPIEEPKIKKMHRPSWTAGKALNQQFCFPWKEEYLKELHKRNIWQLPTRNLQNKDMVVV